MINSEQIREILSLYKKHGWNLSRVLLSVGLKTSLAQEKLEELFGETEIIESSLDAVWFSRPSKNGKNAWELRHLSIKPYALIEFIDEDEDESVLEEMRKLLESRLKDFKSK